MEREVSAQLRFWLAASRSRKTACGIAAINFCVYSCLGLEKICSIVFTLHDLALMENGDAIANSGDRREIVRDVKNGHSGGPIQFAKERQNFGLRDHIESAGGFIGDEQRGTMHDRHGNEHALCLSHAHLRRIFAQKVIVGGQRNALQAMSGSQPYIPRSYPTRGRARLL